MKIELENMNRDGEGTNPTSRGDKYYESLRPNAGANCDSAECKGEPDCDSDNCRLVMSTGALLIGISGLALGCLCPDAIPVAGCSTSVKAGGRLGFLFGLCFFGG